MRKCINKIISFLNILLNKILSFLFLCVVVLMYGIYSVTSDGVLIDTITEGSGDPFCPVTNRKGGVSIPRETLLLYYYN